MSINKENYEEYFLLYADNELTAEQKSEVEEFVNNHPLLKKELEEILATIQHPDNNLFDKSFLFKPVSNAFITEDNYEEKFVEYYDGELNDEEKHTVETFVAENNRYQNDFRFIRMSKLTPGDEVTYPWKSDLYKKEKVFYLSAYIKYAAAAVLTGLVLWFGKDVLFNREAANEENQIAAMTGNEKPEIHHNEANTTVEINTQPAKPEQREQKKNYVNNPVSPNPVYTRNKNVMQPHREALPVETVYTPETENNLSDSEGTLALSKGLDVAPVKEVPATAGLATSLSHTSLEDLKPAGELKSATEETFIPNFGSEPNPSSDFALLDIPLENIKNSKVGVLIKKVKRTIDRTNPLNRLFNED